MMVDLATLVRAYGDLPKRDRLHIAGRWRLCPMPAVAAHVPASGTVVDLGCGHGLFTQLLARTAPERAVIGMDLDPHKIDVARRVQLPNLDFRVGDIVDATLSPARAITILDVLYLVPYEAQQRVIQACVDRLSAGGLLLVKDMSERPRWKVALNWLEEWLAVRVLRITLGGQFYFRSRADWEALLTHCGLEVQTVPLDKGYYHPHVLFIGRKTA